MCGAAIDTDEKRGQFTCSCHGAPRLFIGVWCSIHEYPTMELCNGHACILFCIIVHMTNTIITMGIQQVLPMVNFYVSIHSHFILAMQDISRPIPASFLDGMTTREPQRMHAVIHHVELCVVKGERFMQFSIK